MKKQYDNALDFRKSLEERLKNQSRKTGVDLQRLRRQVAFDRLLCRLFKFFSNDLLLKGGYAMELRFDYARTTKDIDLVLHASRIGLSENRDQIIRQLLQDAIRQNIDDQFQFLVGEATHDLEATPYGGSRFPIDASLGATLFVRFPIDIVVSSLLISPIDHVESGDWLQFAGIDKMSFPTISMEQQFSEKLHAYTLPRAQLENSRVKDLIDLALLVQKNGLDKNKLFTAIQRVFEYRKTHTVPTGLTEPPPSWSGPFEKLRRDCALNTNMDETMEQLATYLNLPIMEKGS
jgi:hypothetical protein